MSEISSDLYVFHVLFLHFSLTSFNLFHVFEIFLIFFQIFLKFSSKYNFPYNLFKIFPKFSSKFLEPVSSFFSTIFEISRYLPEIPGYTFSVFPAHLLNFRAIYLKFSATFFSNIFHKYGSYTISQISLNVVQCFLIFPYFSLIFPYVSEFFKILNQFSSNFSLPPFLFSIYFVNLLNFYKLPAILPLFTKEHLTHSRIVVLFHTF